MSSVQMGVRYSTTILIVAAMATLNEAAVASSPKRIVRECVRIEMPTPRPMSPACHEARLSAAEKAVKKKKFSDALFYLHGQRRPWQCDNDRVLPWSDPEATTPAQVRERAIERVACDPTKVEIEARSKEVQRLLSALDKVAGPNDVDAVLKAMVLLPGGFHPSLTLRQRLRATIHPHLESWIAADPGNLRSGLLEVYLGMVEPDPSLSAISSLEYNKERRANIERHLARTAWHEAFVLRVDESWHDAEVFEDPDSVRARIQAHFDGLLAATLGAVREDPDLWSRWMALSRLQRDLDGPKGLPERVSFIRAAAEELRRERAEMMLAVAEWLDDREKTSSLRAALEAGMVLRETADANSRRTPAARALVEGRAPFEARVAREAEVLRTRMAREKEVGGVYFYHSLLLQLGNKSAGSLVSVSPYDLKVEYPATSPSCPIAFRPKLLAPKTEGISVVAHVQMKRCDFQESRTFLRNRTQHEVVRTDVIHDTCLETDMTGKCTRRGAQTVDTTREVVVAQYERVVEGNAEVEIVVRWDGGSWRTTRTASARATDAEGCMGSGSKPKNAQCFAFDEVRGRLVGKLADNMDFILSAHNLTQAMMETHHGRLRTADATRDQDPARAVGWYSGAAIAGLDLGEDRLSWLASYLKIPVEMLPRYLSGR